MLKKMLGNFEEIILGITMISMVTINFGNVVSRYFLHQSWAFTEEILIIFFVYNSLIGAAIAMKRGCHLGFTALIDRFSMRVRKAALLSSTIGILILMLILAYYGIGMCKNQYIFDQRTPALAIPEWLSGISIPIAAFLIGFRAIQFCFIELRMLKKEAADDSKKEMKNHSICAGGKI